MSSDPSHTIDGFFQKLRFPDDAALKRFVYFTPDFWPAISKIIQDFLQEKDFFNSVAPMIEKDPNGFPHPWIIVRVIPQSAGAIIKNLEKEIKEQLYQHGFDDATYNIHVDNAKRGDRPAPIDTEFKEGAYRELAVDSVYSKPAKDAIPTPRRLSITGELPNITDPRIGEAIRASQRMSGSLRSVKHLTCWYWCNHPKGCLKTAKECLYAHRDTGRYADQPRIVVPGGPRLAGRNASRLQEALRETYKGYGDNEYAGVGSAVPGSKGKGRADNSAGHFSKMDNDNLYSAAGRNAYVYSPRDVPETSESHVDNTGMLQASDIIETVENLALASKNDAGKENGDVVTAGPSRSSSDTLKTVNAGGNSAAQHDGSDGSKTGSDNTAPKAATTDNSPHTMTAAKSRRNRRKRRNAVMLGQTVEPLSPHSTAVLANLSSRAGNNGTAEAAPSKPKTEVDDAIKGHKKQDSGTFAERLKASGVLDPSKTASDTRNQLRRANTRLVLGAREFNIGHDQTSAEINNVHEMLRVCGNMVEQLLPQPDDQSFEARAFNLLWTKLGEAYHRVEYIDKLMDLYDKRAFKILKTDCNAESIFSWYNNTDAEFDAHQTMIAAPGFADQANHLPGILEQYEADLAAAESDKNGKEQVVDKQDPSSSNVFDIKKPAVSKAGVTAQGSTTGAKPTIKVTGTTAEEQEKKELGAKIMADFLEHENDSDEGGVEIIV